MENSSAGNWFDLAIKLYHKQWSFSTLFFGSEQLLQLEVFGVVDTFDGDVVELFFEFKADEVPAGSGEVFARDETCGFDN